MVLKIEYSSKSYSSSNIRANRTVSLRATNILSLYVCLLAACLATYTMGNRLALHFKYKDKDHSIVFKKKHLDRLGRLFEEFLAWKKRKKTYKRKLKNTAKDSHAFAVLERKRKHASDEEKRSLSEVNALVKKETVFFYTVKSLKAIVRAFHGE